MGKPIINKLVIIGCTIHSAKQLQLTFGARDNKSILSSRALNRAL